MCQMQQLGIHFVNRGSLHRQQQLLWVIVRSKCLAAYCNSLVPTYEQKAGSRRCKKNDRCQLIKRSDFELWYTRVGTSMQSPHRNTHTHTHSWHGALLLEECHANCDVSAGHKIAALSKPLKTTACNSSLHSSRESL